MFIRSLLILATCGGIWTLNALAHAQSAKRYATTVEVNESVITNYEINQRADMLRFFGTIGDVRASAITQLIDERLYLQAGDALDIRPSTLEVQDAMEKFANRADLTSEELLQLLEARGISEQSYRDFILAGLTWQIVIQNRFTSQADVSELEIQNALRSVNKASGQEFRFSEIILPYDELGVENANKLALRLSNTIKDETAFADAARKYSKWPSAEFGGQIDWTDGAALAPNLLAQFLVMKQGQITGPIALQNNQVSLYFLQAVRDRKNQEPNAPDVVEYAILRLPDTLGAQSTRDATARVIRSEVDNCFDLREQATPYGQDSYQSYDGSTTQENIPAAIAKALNDLDSKESATVQISETQTAVVMVCKRGAALDETARNRLRLNLLDRKFANLGNGYLQELRAEAYIRRR